VVNGGWQMVIDDELFFFQQVLISYRLMDAGG